MGIWQTWILIMTNDDLLSKTISFLRFPLTVGVVFIHFNIVNDGFTINGIKCGLNNPDWYYYTINFFSEVLPRLCVPLFFLISGFLFYYRKNFNYNVYKQKLRTRTMTLLIPYFLWNIIAILITSSKKLPFISSIFPNESNMNIILSPERIFKTFFAYSPNEGIFVNPIIEDATTNVSLVPLPINTPMWYVRELIVMVIITPIIYWLIKRSGLLFITFLGVVWYLLKPLHLDESYLGPFSCAAFFFSCGAYFSINRMNFVDYMRKFKYMPILYLLLAIVDTLTKNAGYNTFIHNAGILAGMYVKDSEFIKFHTKVNIQYAIVSILILLLFIIPIVGWICGSILLLVVLVCKIISIVYVFQGKAKDAPIIGSLGFLKF